MQLFSAEQQLSGSIVHLCASVPGASLPVLARLPRPPYLCHEPVGARVLLILEDNICVVIRRQFFKALGVARNLALGSPAGSQGLLGHVGAELLVSERDELLREPPLAVPPPRPAALRGRCEEEDQGTQRGGEKEEGDPHRPGGKEDSPGGERCLQYLPGSVPDSIVRDSRDITSEKLGLKKLGTSAAPGTMRTPK